MILSAATMGLCGRGGLWERWAGFASLRRAIGIDEVLFKALQIALELQYAMLV